MRALFAPLQDGKVRSVGVPPANDPSTVLAVCVASAELGIALAATASDGVVVLFVTVGTSQDGHDPEGAEKSVTEPPPVPDPVKLQMFPTQPPAPALKVNVKAPVVLLIEETPPPPPPPLQAAKCWTPRESM